MKKHEAFPSKYFRAVDVTTPVTLTIKGVRSETFENDGRTKTQRVLAFREDDRELVLNDTRWDACMDITGKDDDDHWVGAKIEIYKSKTRFGRDMVDCTAIRPPSGNSQADDIPF